MQVYLTVKFNKQTTTTLSPKETVCERTSWKSATGGSRFADATEKAREKTHYQTACNVKVKEARTRSPRFMNVPICGQSRH